jgi:hypothetical protein
LTKRIFVVIAALLTCLDLTSCSGYKSGSPGGITNRVLASQGVTSTSIFGGLVTVNGFNDTLPGGIPTVTAGTSPRLMAISPARNIVAAFDSGSNTVFAADTTKETSLGQVRLPGPTFSMTVPTSSAVGYAAVPTATVLGFPGVLGAVEVMNLSAGSITSTIAVTKAQTVIPNADGSQLLVFSNDSDSMTLLTPARALPGVDLSCLSTTNPPPNAVCSIVPGFDRPVFAIVNQTTAYVLNCGAECGGTQASVQVVDLSTPTPTLVGVPVKVNGATYGFLSGTNLYVAGKGTPNGPLCSSLTNPINPQTAATFCGTLDVVNLTTMTDPFFGNTAMEIAIPDGTHNRMDMSINGQLFIGSSGCQDIGNVSNPVGEVRGCLAIYNTNNNSLVIPPDNGDVGGLQSFTSREIEYVAEGGELRVYDTTKDILLINDFVPQGTINIVGYVGDIKAIDFF